MMRGEPDPRPEGGEARMALEANLKATLGDKRLRQLVEKTGWNLKAE